MIILCPDIVCDFDDEEVLCYNRTSKETAVLNPTASLYVKKCINCDESTSQERYCEEIKNMFLEYPADKQLKNDAKKIMESLIDRKILTVR